jgi:23S rRNA U2552 (ribose-2'-O)-methylase RlmE/FtsJ
MIVINKTYLEDFETEKSKIQSLLDINFIDILPIEIKEDLFILPDNVLQDETFKEIFVNFKNYVIREVTEDEFIKYEIK